MVKRIPVSASDITERVDRQWPKWSGRVALVPKTDGFERMVADYIEVKHGLAVSSGPAQSSRPWSRMSRPGSRSAGSLRGGLRGTGEIGPNSLLKCIRDACLRELRNADRFLDLVQDLVYIEVEWRSECRWK